MKQRNKYCDVLRFIAIVMVVAIHVFADFRDTYIQTNRLYYLVLTFLDSITRVGVPLFFMLTGIFMLSNSKEKSLGEFYKKRLPKLIIPFIVFSICYYIFNQYTNSQTISIIDFLKKLSNNQIKYHLWFMYGIITIYIFIPFLQKLIKGLNRKYLRNLIIIIYIFGNLVLTIQTGARKLGIDILSTISLPNLCIYINYVFLGYYLNKYNIKKKHRKVIYILGIVATIIMPLADSFFAKTERDDFLLSVTSIFPIFQASAIFLLFKYNYEKLKVKEKINKFFQKTASITFYIYLSHVLVMELLKQYVIKIDYFAKRLVTLTIYNIIIFILTFIISYIVSIIADKIYNFISKKIKKINYKNILKKT